MRAEKTDQSNSSLETDDGDQTNGWISGSGFKYERYDISSLGHKNHVAFKQALENGANLPLYESGLRWQLYSPSFYGSYYG